jgi:hypothetical protein
MNNLYVILILPCVTASNETREYKMENICKFKSVFIIIIIIITD